MKTPEIADRGNPDFALAGDTQTKNTFTIASSSVKSNYANGLFLACQLCPAFCNRASQWSAFLYGQPGGRARRMRYLQRKVSFMKKHLIILNPSAAKGTAIAKNLRSTNFCGMRFGLHTRRFRKPGALWRWRHKPANRDTMSWWLSGRRDGQEVING